MLMLEKTDIFPLLGGLRYSCFKSDPMFACHERLNGSVV
jgi:hypothetical protein